MSIAIILIDSKQLGYFSICYLERAGLREFTGCDDKERFRLYRKYVYETGAVNKSGKS